MFIRPELHQNNYVYLYKVSKNSEFLLRRDKGGQSSWYLYKRDFILAPRGKDNFLNYSLIKRGRLDQCANDTKMFMSYINLIVKENRTPRI
jgi:hypothetical protein